MSSLVAEERFGDLLLLARWHLGPCTEVFVARQGSDPGAPPAIVKRMLPHVRDDARVRAEFEREARLLATLDDAHFPRLLGQGERHGLPFLVLEFRPGPTVREVAAASATLPRGPEWTAVALALALGALEGLVVLHRRRPPIVHGDVSPENLLVLPEGGVVILDLGVARRQGEPFEEAVGKRAYMGPEHLAGRPLDARADLYALGVVLWELLSGVRPSSAADADGRLPPLDSTRAGADDAVARLVARLAAPSPADRPAGAAPAMRTLRAWLRRAGVADPRALVAGALTRLFDPVARSAWSPDPSEWREVRRVSAEERGEETTNRQPSRVADITEVVEPVR